MKTSLHFIGEIGVVNLQPQHLEPIRNKKQFVKPFET